MSPVVGEERVKPSIRVVLAYIVAAGLWIVVTDALVVALGINEGIFQLLKGLFFVVVTAAVLAVVLGREERRRADATAQADLHRIALEDREREYRSLFDANPQAMWVLDAQTAAFLAVNQTALDTYGYSRDEFLALRVEALSESDVTLPGASDSDVGELQRHRTKSGELLYVSIASNLVHFEGRAANLVLAANVTSRVEAERALAAAKRQVEAIIDTSPMAIILLDCDAKVRLWNPAAVRIFGWSAEEVLGGFYPIVPEDRAEEFSDIFTSVLAGHPLEGVQLTRRNKDGEQLSVMCFSAALASETGEVEGAIGMFADIGEQVRSEAELSRYRERLEELVQARTAELSIANERLSTATRVKSEFLANMSHELRTPLNSIIGFSGAMLQGLAGDLSEEQRKQLGMVYRSGKHLLELINDILDLSKIEAGRFTVETQEFDAHEIVLSVVESLDLQVAGSGLEVRAPEPHEPVLINTDRTKVRQILINLIGNAVKFTEEGFVEVTVERDADDVVVLVKDTGPGIPQAEHALIFDEFTQSERRADEKPQGTGLGLAISRRLARILGGDIELTSAPGDGSAFRLRIPAVCRIPEASTLAVQQSDVQRAQME